MVTARSSAGPPRRLGPCEIVSLLGAGSMASVHAAIVRGEGLGVPMGTDVIVKVMRPELAASSPALLERFRREAALGARLRIEGLVRTLGSGSHEDGGPWHYVVLERVGGASLRQLLRERGRLEETEARRVAAGLARALAALHAEGVVHRDVKPENVMVGDDLVATLIDLGIARDEDAETLTSFGEFLGTLTAAAPECLTGAAAGPEADCYALGVLLHECLTGTNPFAGSDPSETIGRHLRGSVPLASESGAAVSAETDALVAALLQRDPDRRPSAEDAADVLERGALAAAWPRVRGRGPVRPAIARLLEHARRPQRGRDAEAARARARVDAAAAGHGGLLLVRGEAGAGKTRFVAGLVQEALDEHHDVTVLHASFHPGDAGGAPIAEALAELGAELSAALEAAFAREPGRAEGVLRAITPTGDGADATRRDMATSAATQALAAHRLVLLVVEDLHFAPPDQRQLVARLATAVLGARVLLVATTRPPGGIEDAELLELGPLDVDDLTQVLEDALAPRRILPSVVRALAERCDGNPYFALSMLRRWDRRMPMDGFEARRLPATLHEALEERLAELSSDERSLLDLAAVQGHELHVDAIAHVLGTTSLSVLQDLGRLERTHGLVRRDGPRIRFEHHALREHLEAALLPELRSAYHRALAAWASASDLPERERVIHVARHALAGGLRDEARAAAAPAARELLGRGDVAAALDVVEKVLDLGIEDARLRAEILLLQADVLTATARDADRCREILRRAEIDARVAGDPRLTARGLQALAKLEIDARAFGEALRLAEEAVTVARETRDDAVLAESLLGLSKAWYFRRDFARARATAVEAAEAAERAGAHGLRGQALVNQATAILVEGRTDEAERLLVEAREACAAAGDVHGAARAIGNLGIIHELRGDYAACRRAWNACLAQARLMGDARYETSPLVNLMLIAFVEGAIEEVDQLATTLIAVERAAATKQLTNRARAVQVFALTEVDPALALRQCEALLEDARARDDRPEQVEMLTHLGVAGFDHDTRERAIARLRECRDMAEAIGATHLAPIARAYLVAAGDEMGHVDVSRLPTVARILAMIGLCRGGRGAAHFDELVTLTLTIARHLRGEARAGFWRRSMFGPQIMRLIRDPELRRGLPPEPLARLERAIGAPE